LKNAKDVSALKAVSQNLMHENLSITDGVYGILSETDVRQQIADLGRIMGEGENQDINTLINAVKHLEEMVGHPKL
jgi:hypothetical protein